MSTAVYISSAAAWIPPAKSANEAVSNGQYAADDFTSNNILCLPVVTDDTSVPDMAVFAARRALDRAEDIVHGQVGMIAHTFLYHQGRDYFWPPASYVQNELEISGAFAVNVQQMSNGGMAALDLATAQLLSGRRTSALVTTADRFCPPGMDRWQGDYGIVYGDGSAAMVLSTTGGFARMLAIESVTDATLERLHRGSQPFTTTPQPTVDVREAKKSYLVALGDGAATVHKRGEELQTNLVNSVLEKAGCTLDDCAKVLLPNMGHALLAAHIKALGISPDRTLMEWGRYTGHLGAGDLIAGVARLVEKREVRPGDYVLLIGSGGGYSMSAAVIKIETVPEWPEMTTGFELPADVTKEA